MWVVVTAEAQGVQQPQQGAGGQQLGCWQSGCRGATPQAAARKGGQCNMPQLLWRCYSA